MPTSEQVNAYIDAVIVPILATHGAREVNRNPWIHLETPSYELQREPTLSIEFRGENVDLLGHDIDREGASLAWFLDNFDGLRDILRDLDGIRDPFHSDIHRRFRAKYGDRHGTRPVSAPIGLGYGWVCDKIEASGRKVWTD